MTIHRRPTALVAGAAVAALTVLGACSSGDDATDRGDRSSTTSSPDQGTSPGDAADDGSDTGGSDAGGSDAGGSASDGPAGGPTAPGGSSSRAEPAGSEQVVAAGRSLADQADAFGDGLDAQVDDVRVQAEQVAGEVAGADGRTSYAVEGSYADLKLQVAEVDREVNSAGGSVPSAAQASWDAFVRSVDELGGTVRISG